ncbi:MAG: hypothetical protein IJO04_03515 [Oscillospiraceae bacterium]|nr:hypothetical protein [Oscillospiraceae bacterium]
MKRFLKGICLVLTMSLLLSVPVMAAPQQEAGTYSSSYFAVLDYYLWLISDTQVQVWFDVIAVDGMDQLGASVIKVQRSSDRTNWETMQTYTPEDNPQMLCPDTTMHADCVTYTYTSGYYYRAFVTFYAKDGRNIGKYSVYTADMWL